MRAPTARAMRLAANSRARGRADALARAAADTAPKRFGETGKRDTPCTVSLRLVGRVASLSDQNLRGQSRAAGGRNEANAQEFGLHAGDGARFACSRGCRVDGLILGVDVGHRALQNNAHRGRRGPEDRLPADRRAGIVRAREAGQRELRPRGGAAGKRFVVEAEADISGKKRTRRGYLLIGGHNVSFSPGFFLIFRALRTISV